MRNSTLVEFTLEPVAEGTRVRIVESGFDALDCTAEQRVAAVVSNTGGWGSELGELVDYARRVAA